MFKPPAPPFRLELDLWLFFFASAAIVYPSGHLGIDSVLADVLPAQKADKVKGLQATGKKVGMVGDGVNDAPALTQANVGFAIGAGNDVALESADVVLMKSDPYDIVAAIELSRATLRKMHQNVWWAVGYNVIALNSFTKTTNAGYLHLTDGARVFYRYCGQDAAGLHRLFGNYDGLIRIHCEAHLDESLRVVEVDVYDFERVQGDLLAEIQVSDDREQ